MRVRALPPIMLLFALVLLSACQGRPAATAGDADPTEPAPVTTATEVPPTATPQATPTTPPPTATPAFEGLLDYTGAYGGSRDSSWQRDTVARYEDLYPGVEVTYRGANLYGSPVPTGFYLFLDSDNRPDVFSSFIVGRLRNYVQAGAIADISDLWEQNGWHDVFPSTVRQAATVDGRQYFVPLALQWNPIWYRTDIFDEVGLQPPQTWDDFLAACDALHDAGYIPVAVATSGWTPPMARWFSILNLRLNGPDFHEALMAGEERYDDERVREVFEHLALLFEHNCFAEDTTNYRQAAQQIFDGEAAMYNLGEWLSESYDEGLPQTFDFFSFPPINPDVPRAEIVHLYGAYAVAEPEHPHEARRFLTHLGSVESQTSNVEALGRVVSHLEVDPALYNDVYRRGLQFVEDAEAITTLFEFNTDPDMAARGLSALGQFWRNPQQIQETMDAMESARQQAYGE